MSAEPESPESRSDLDAPPAGRSLARESAEVESALAEGAICGVHPERAAVFVCTRCGTFGCEACAFALLKEREVCHPCAQKGLGEAVPWERRTELGTWTAYWKTVRFATRSPTAFFRTPATTASMLAPMAHGVASSTIALLLSYIVAGLLLMLSGGVAALAVEGELGITLGAGLGMYGCFVMGMSPLALVFAPAQALMAIVVAAAASHGVLALFKKTRASFEQTLRAVSYANSAAVWGWVPVLGMFAYFWTIYVEVIALRETHRCGTDWAVAAVLGYRLALFLVLIAAYAALFGGLFLLERT